jgi:hypothetical protein
MNKFNFNEIVKVQSSDPDLSEVNGKKGVVRGMGESEDGIWAYAVDIDEDDEGWSFFEVDLVSLNCFAKEEDFHTGESMKVIVTPDGKGSIKDE